MQKIKEYAKKHKTFIIFTLLFAITTIGVYWLFLKGKISFIWNTDGLKQHYIILYDFNEMIRNVFKQGISTFSLNMGLGLDVIEQYSYYVIGDPFAWLSLLFPLDKLEYVYSILIVLRMYCIGLAFMAYCKYHKKDELPTIVGSLAYAFCGFVLYGGIRHPYFLNALILLPIIFIGIDKLLKENKKGLFIFSIFISAIVNYYFFYILTIVAVIYAIVKLIFEYRDRGAKWITNIVLKGIGYYIVGVLMSACILLPTIYGFLNSARVESDIAVVFKETFYEQFMMGYTIIENESWHIIGITSIFIPLFGVMLVNLRENKEVFTIFCIMTIMSLLPQIASIMNGFSYPTNRWIFAYIFIIVCIIVKNFRTNLKYDKREILSMIITTSIYINLSFILWKYNKANYFIFRINMIFAIVFILIVIIRKIIYIKNIKINKLVNITSSCMIVIVVILNITVNANHFYGKSGSNYIASFSKYSQIDKKYKSENGKIEHFEEAIEYIKNNDKSIYRIGKLPLSLENTSLMYNYNSLSSYLSIGSKYVYEFAKSIDLNNSAKNKTAITDMNNRTQAMTFLGTKYIICNQESEKYIPYGYKKIKTIENTQIYENLNSLNIGIFYDKYIQDEEYNNLEAIEREIALLDYATIGNTTLPNGIEHGSVLDIQSQKTNVDYDIIDENNILKDNKITIGKDKNTIKLKVKDKDKENIEELFLKIDNLRFIRKEDDATTKYTVKVKYNGKTIEEETKGLTSIDYDNNPNILINIGKYISDYDNENNVIEIEFDSSEGTFYYDSIELVSVSMDEYEKQVEKLNQTPFENIEYSGNTIKGTISNEKDGILQLTVPYSDGWRVIVDGEEKELLNVNTGFIGVALESGEHKIIFEYHTPWLTAGIIISIIGLIIFILILIIDRRSNERNSNKV